jgi:hypothetical protein
MQNQPLYLSCQTNCGLDGICGESDGIGRIDVVEL